MLNIARNNSFPCNRMNDFKNQIEHYKSYHKMNSSANKKKWVTFAY